MTLFEDLGISQELLNTVKKLNFEKPTEIQEQSIPLIMDNKDVIGESATGSGKTLAFGAGIIKKVEPKKGLQSLILTPTRELALQVSDALKEFSERKLKIVTVYGGVGIDKQIFDLRKADVVVATPGRLLDHLQRRTIDLSRIKVLVLDEADRMLDMGFIDDVERIISQCPRERQTLFFSATISAQIRSLADRFMNNPMKVSAKKQVDPSKLKQVYYDISKNQKLSLLVYLLKNEHSGLVMVFCRTRSNTDFVVKNLCANDIEAIAIHGGLSQNKRTRTIQNFNDGKMHVLVCTDVAARGLHIENVSHVYNYDVPADPKDYVHRIGRTARAGEKGKVVNLLCNADFDNFSRIMTDYREFTIKKMDVPQLPKIIVKRTEERRDGYRGRGGGYGRGRSSGYNQGRRGNSYRARTEHRSSESRGQGSGRSYGRGRSNDSGRSGERRDSSSSGGYGRSRDSSSSGSRSYGDRKPSGNFNKRRSSGGSRGQGGRSGSRSSGRSQSRNSYY